MEKLLNRIAQVGVGGPLDGVTLGHWLGMLYSDGMTQRNLKSPVKTFLVTSRNSVLSLLEQARFSAGIRATEVRQPIFVLGYWRSGTTHLHNLLSVDDRLAAPNHYEVRHPRTFLLTEELFRRSRPRTEYTTRRQDNVAVGPFLAAEDEYALVSLTRCSLYRGLLAPPSRSPHYERFLTFQEASRSEAESWQKAIRLFLKKVTIKNDGRQLVMKSPGHTARIKMLLESFPDAKFIHIHRNPFAVFRSAERASLRGSGGDVAAQVIDQLHERILERYAEVYEAFFAQRELVPATQYCEVGFEDLDLDLVGELRRIYQELNLPPFEETEVALKQYVEEISGYRKSKHPPIEADLAERIATRWQRSFREWGYDPGVGAGS